MTAMFLTSSDATVTV